MKPTDDEQAALRFAYDEFMRRINRLMDNYAQDADTARDQAREAAANGAYPEAVCLYEEAARYHATVSDVGTLAQLGYQQLLSLYADTKSPVVEMPDEDLLMQGNFVAADEYDLGSRKVFGIMLSRQVSKSPTDRWLDEIAVLKTPGAAPLKWEWTRVKVWSDSVRPMTPHEASKFMRLMDNSGIYATGWSSV
jgi:hypothetical protein